LPPGRSMVAIATLSALSWMVLIAAIMAVRAVL
jgi:hypothetical protein